jgi:hypothetical protein
VVQAGPVYDNAMKAMCTAVPMALCRWLGVEVLGEVEPIRISEMAPAKRRPPRRRAGGRGR